MKKLRQLQLFKADLRFFGGRLLHGRRRSARPLSSREPIHLVLRSSWACGENSLLRPRNKNEISRLVRATAAKYFVRIYQVAIAGNHLHLVVRIPRRQHYKTFVRVLSSRIASHVMRRQSFLVFKRGLAHAKRGDPHPGSAEVQGLEQQFWQFRPWSRVLHWGRDFKTCCSYVRQNTLEALGFIPYQVRKNRYLQWLGETAPRLMLE